jgi:hypothetical protein
VKAWQEKPAGHFEINHRTAFVIRSSASTLTCIKVIARDSFNTVRYVSKRTISLPRESPPPPSPPPPLSSSSLSLFDKSRHLFITIHCLLLLLLFPVFFCCCRWSADPASHHHSTDFPSSTELDIQSLSLFISLRNTCRNTPNTVSSPRTTTFTQPHSPQPSLLLTLSLTTAAAASAQ